MQQEPVITTEQMIAANTTHFVWAMTSAKRIMNMLVGYKYPFSL